MPTHHFEPSSIAPGPCENVWIVDWAANLLSVCLIEMFLQWTKLTIFSLFWGLNDTVTTESPKHGFFEKTFSHSCRTISFDKYQFEFSLPQQWHNKFRWLTLFTEKLFTHVCEMAMSENTFTSRWEKENGSSVQNTSRRQKSCKA